MERYRSDEKNAGDTATFSARRRLGRATPRRRSAGLRTLDDLDGRTKAARLAQRLVGGLVRDLGGELTTAQQQLAQRIALAGALAEDLEARWLAGEEIDLADYVRVANAQRRMLATIGLGRVQPTTIDMTEQALAYMREASA